MRELTPKEAFERLQGELDPRTLDAIKEVVLKQATTYPNKQPIFRFYEEGDGVRIAMDEQFRDLFNKLLGEE